MNSYKSPTLQGGWQARLYLFRSCDGPLVVKKIYGTGKRWGRQNIKDVTAAQHTYQNWLHKNGVCVLAPISEDHFRTVSGWRLVIQQPYIGPDCEALLRSAGHLAPTDVAAHIFRPLLKTALDLSFNPIRPLIRCEVKPRDFCLRGNGDLTLVDTFPPVLACRKGSIVAATRRSTKSCLIDREADEVLSVTGSTLGVLRNLCEHVIAASALPPRGLINMAAKFVARYDKHLSKKLKARLNSTDSLEKVNRLRARLVSWR